jgi:CubicO group peptidase (beta-lactamase class C family)
MNKKSFNLMAIIICSIFLHIYTRDNTGQWFIKEQKILNQHKHNIAKEYWNINIIQKTDYDHSLIKNILTTRSTSKNTTKQIVDSFDEAIQTKNFNLFASLFSSLDNLGISIIQHEARLSAPLQYANFYPCKKNTVINPTDIKELKQYIRDSDFSGIVSICSTHYAETITSSEIIDPNTSFSIHSISKMFTGILMLIMIQENIVPEAWLQQPLQIRDTTKKLLSSDIIEQLNKVTVHQIMTHRGGFGDYTVNYFDTLAQKVQNGEQISSIQKLEDFLCYADNKITMLNDNETCYSNLGLLLLGLSIEHCHNNAFTNAHLSFDEILQKYVIQPAGMKIFSSQKPTNACYNESGSCSQYICGTPAGGHWTTAQDLQKFGIWLQNKYSSDTEFKRLLDTYGHEFYSNETQEMHHTGGIGQPGIGEASARFSLFLRHGISIITLSNRPQQAFNMYKAIYHNILADKKS